MKKLIIALAVAFTLMLSGGHITLAETHMDMKIVNGMCGAIGITVTDTGTDNIVAELGLQEGESGNIQLKCDGLFDVYMFFIHSTTGEVESQVTYWRIVCDKPGTTTVTIIPREGQCAGEKVEADKA